MSQNKSHRSRLSQALAVTLAASMVLTTPGMTSWAAAVTETTTTTPKKSSLSATQAIQFAEQAANTIHSFAVGPNSDPASSYKPILAGYNDDGSPGAFSAYSGQFVAENLGPNVLLATAQNPGVGFHAASAFDHDMQIDAAQLNPTISNSVQVVAEPTQSQFQQVSNLAEIKSEVAQIEKADSDAATQLIESVSNPLTIVDNAYIAGNEGYIQNLADESAKSLADASASLNQALSEARPGATGIQDLEDKADQDISKAGDAYNQARAAYANLAQGYATSEKRLEQELADAKAIDPKGQSMITEADGTKISVVNDLQQKLDNLHQQQQDVANKQQQLVTMYTALSQMKSVDQADKALIKQQMDGDGGVISALNHALNGSVNMQVDFWGAEYRVAIGEGKMLVGGAAAVAGGAIYAITNDGGERLTDWGLDTAKEGYSDVKSTLESLAGDTVPTADQIAAAHNALDAGKQTQKNLDPVQKSDYDGLKSSLGNIGTQISRPQAEALKRLANQYNENKASTWVQKVKNDLQSPNGSASDGMQQDYSQAYGAHDKVMSQVEGIAGNLVKLQSAISSGALGDLKGIAATISSQFRNAKADVLTLYAQTSDGLGMQNSILQTNSMYDTWMKEQVYAPLLNMDPSQFGSEKDFLDYYEKLTNAAAPGAYSNAQSYAAALESFGVYSSASNAYQSALSSVQSQYKDVFDYEKPSLPQMMLNDFFKVGTMPFRIAWDGTMIVGGEYLISQGYGLGSDNVSNYVFSHQVDLANNLHDLLEVDKNAVLPQWMEPVYNPNTKEWVGPTYDENKLSVNGTKGVWVDGNGNAIPGMQQGILGSLAAKGYDENGNALYDFKNALNYVTPDEMSKSWINEAAASGSDADLIGRTLAVGAYKALRTAGDMATFGLITGGVASMADGLSAAPEIFSLGLTDEGLAFGKFMTTATTDALGKTLAADYYMPYTMKPMDLTMQYHFVDDTLLNLKQFMANVTDPSHYHENAGTIANELAEFGSTVGGMGLSHYVGQYSPVAPDGQEQVSLVKAMWNSTVDFTGQVIGGGIGSVLGPVGELAGISAAAVVPKIVDYAVGQATQLNTLAKTVNNTNSTDSASFTHRVLVSGLEGQLESPISVMSPEAKAQLKNAVSGDAPDATGAPSGQVTTLDLRTGAIETIDRSSLTDGSAGARVDLSNSVVRDAVTNALARADAAGENASNDKDAGSGVWSSIKTAVSNLSGDTKPETLESLAKNPSTGKDSSGFWATMLKLSGDTKPETLDSLAKNPSTSLAPEAPADPASIYRDIQRQTAQAEAAYRNNPSDATLADYKAKLDNQTKADQALAALGGETQSDPKADAKSKAAEEAAAKKVTSLLRSAGADSSDIASLAQTVRAQSQLTLMQQANVDSIRQSQAEAAIELMQSSLPRDVHQQILDSITNHMTVTESDGHYYLNGVKAPNTEVVSGVLKMALDAQKSNSAGPSIGADGFVTPSAAAPVSAPKAVDLGPNPAATLADLQKYTDYSAKIAALNPGDIRMAQAYQESVAQEQQAIQSGLANPSSEQPLNQAALSARLQTLDAHAQAAQAHVDLATLPNTVENAAARQPALDNLQQAQTKLAEAPASPVEAAAAPEVAAEIPEAIDAVALAERPTMATVDSLMSQLSEEASPSQRHLDELESDLENGLPLGPAEEASSADPLQRFQDELNAELTDGSFLPSMPEARPDVIEAPSDIPSGAVEEPVGLEPAGADQPEPAGHSAAVAQASGRELSPLRRQELMAQLHGDTEGVEHAQAQQRSEKAKEAVQNLDDRLTRLGDARQTLDRVSEEFETSSPARARLTRAELSKIDNEISELRAQRQNALDAGDQQAKADELMAQIEAREKGKFEEAARRVADRETATWQVHAENIEGIAAGKKPLSSDDLQKQIDDRVTKIQAARDKAEGKKLPYESLDPSAAEAKARDALDNANKRVQSDREAAADFEDLLRQRVQALDGIRGTTNFFKRGQFRSELNEVNRKIQRFNLIEQSQQMGARIAELELLEARGTGGQNKLSLMDARELATLRYNKAIADIKVQLLDIGRTTEFDSRSRFEGPLGLNRSAESETRSAQKSEAQVLKNAKETLDALAKIKDEADKLLTRRIQSINLSEANDKLSEARDESANIGKATSNAEKFFSDLNEKMSQADEALKAQLSSLVARLNSSSMDERSKIFEQGLEAQLKSVAKPTDVDSESKSPAAIDDAALRKSISDLRDRVSKNYEQSARRASIEVKLAKATADAIKWESRNENAIDPITSRVSKYFANRAYEDFAKAQNEQLTDYLGPEISKILNQTIRTRDDAAKLVEEIERSLAAKFLESDKFQTKLRKEINKSEELRTILDKLGIKESDRITSEALKAILASSDGQKAVEESVWKKPAAAPGSEAPKMSPQRKALIDLFTGDSIELGTAAGKSLLSGLFALGKEADGKLAQVTVLLPSKFLAKKFFRDNPNGIKLPDILQDVAKNMGYERKVYDIEDEYKKYQDHQPNELINALRDPNAVLIVSRDTHGFMALAAQSDGDLDTALNKSLDNGVKRRLIMDEVHKLSDSMAFILGDSSNKVLSETDDAWIKSMHLKDMISDGSVDMVMTRADYDAARYSDNKAAFWYDKAGKDVYLTPQAVELIKETYKAKYSENITSGEMKEFFKAWGQSVAGEGAQVRETPDSGFHKIVVPVDATGTAQMNRSYHSEMYAAGFAAHALYKGEEGVGAHSVKLTETKMQVGEAQAFKRYDSIQGMTATAGGARKLLSNKIAFNAAETDASGDFKHANIEFLDKDQQPDMAKYASRISDFFSTMREGLGDLRDKRLVRALGVELTDDQVASLEAELKKSGSNLTIEKVSGNVLEDENYADYLRGANYEEWLKASESKRQEMMDEWVKNDSQGPPPSKPPADIIILQGPAGKAAGETGIDWRGDMYMFGDVSYHSSADFDQLKGRAERADNRLKNGEAITDLSNLEQRLSVDGKSKGSLKSTIRDGNNTYIAVRDFWVHNQVHEDAMSHINLQANALETLWKGKTTILINQNGEDPNALGVREDKVLLTDLLKNRDSLNASQRAELVRQYFQEVESSRGMLSEARENNLKTGRLQFLQQFSKLVEGTANAPLISKYIQKATQDSPGEVPYTPEENILDPKQRIIQDWNQEKNSTIEMLRAMNKDITDQGAKLLKMWENPSLRQAVVKELNVQTEAQAQKILERTMLKNNAIQGVLSSYAKSLSKLDASTIEAGRRLGDRPLNSTNVHTLSDALVYGLQISKDILPIEISPSEKVVAVESTISKAIQALPRPMVPVASESEAVGVPENPEDLGTVLPTAGPPTVTMLPPDSEVRTPAIADDLLPTHTLAVAGVERQPSPTAQVGLLEAPAPEVPVNVGTNRSISDQAIKPSSVVATPVVSQDLIRPVLANLRAQAIEAVQQNGTGVPPLVAALASSASLDEAAKILYKQAGLTVPKSGAIKNGSVKEWWDAVAGNKNSYVRRMVANVKQFGLKTLIQPSTLPINTRNQLLINAAVSSQGEKLMPLLKVKAAETDLVTSLSDSAIKNFGRKAGARGAMLVDELKAVREISHSAPALKGETKYGYTVSPVRNGTVHIYLSNLKEPALLKILALSKFVGLMPGYRLVIHAPSNGDAERLKIIDGIVKGSNGAVVLQKGSTFSPITWIQGKIHSIGKPERSAIADLSRAVATVGAYQDAQASMSSDPANLMTAFQAVNTAKAQMDDALLRLKLSAPQLSLASLVGVLNLPTDVREVLNELRVASASEGTDAIEQVLKQYLNPTKMKREPIHGISPDTTVVYVPANITPARYASDYVRRALTQAKQNPATAVWAAQTEKAFDEAMSAANAPTSIHDVLHTARALALDARPGKRTPAATVKAINKSINQIFPSPKTMLPAFGETVTDIRRAFFNAVRETIAPELEGRDLTSVALVTADGYPDAGTGELKAFAGNQKHYQVISEKKYQEILNGWKAADQSAADKSIQSLLPALNAAVAVPKFSETLRASIRQLLSGKVSSASSSADTNSPVANVTPFATGISSLGMPVRMALASAAGFLILGYQYLSMHGIVPDMPALLSLPSLISVPHQTMSLGGSGLTVLFGGIPLYVAMVIGGKFKTPVVSYIANAKRLAAVLSAA